MNINDSSEIKMNWTFALAVSVVIHVVGLGLVMLCSDAPGEADEVATQELAADRSSDSGETGNAESDSAPSQTPQATSPGRVDPPAPASAARRTPQPRPSARASTTSTSSSASIMPATPATASTAPATDAGSSASRPAASSPATKTIVYEVKPGDNLTKIAKKHKCTVTEIAKLNKMKPNRVLWVGLKLKIPAPVE